MPLARIEAVTPPGVQVACVTPNAPSLTGCGFDLVIFSAGCDEEHQAELLEMLSCLGETFVVCHEQVNWCMGLSGAAMARGCQF
ncbi:MAG: hypothetical protein ACOYYS_16285 [Chloroflexota bacterium]